MQAIQSLPTRRCLFVLRSGRWTDMPSSPDSRCRKAHRPICKLFFSRSCSYSIIRRNIKHYTYITVIFLSRVVLIVILDLSSVYHFLDLISVVGNGCVNLFKCILQIGEHIVEVDGIQLLHLILEIVENTVYVVEST